MNPMPEDAEHKVRKLMPDCFDGDCPQSDAITVLESKVMELEKSVDAMNGVLSSTLASIQKEVRSISDKIDNGGLSVTIKNGNNINAVMRVSDLMQLFYDHLTGSFKTAESAFLRFVTLMKGIWWIAAAIGGVLYILHQFISFHPLQLIP